MELKKSLVWIAVVLVLGVGSMAAAVTPEEQAEISAALATAAPTGEVGEPIANPDAAARGGGSIYFSDFESNNGGLTPSLDWEWGVFAWAPGSNCGSYTNAPPAAAYSGASMWGLVLNDCYNSLSNNSGYGTCTNDNTADDNILSLTVDLTDYANAQLTWWEWNDLFMDFDWGEVYVDGTVVFQHCGSGYTAPTAWVQQMVDLTPFVGAPVTIEFHAMTSAVVNYAGWYIDDLEIIGTPVPVDLQSFTIE